MIVYKSIHTLHLIKLKTMIEIDETKLSHQELELIDRLLYNRFHEGALKKECEDILKTRKKLGMDIQKNMMVSDYEYHFDTKVVFKSIK